MKNSYMKEGKMDGKEFMERNRVGHMNKRLENRNRSKQKRDERMRVAAEFFHCCKLQHNERRKRGKKEQEDCERLRNTHQHQLAQERERERKLLTAITIIADGGSGGRMRGWREGMWKGEGVREGR